jgi:exosortase/archaeosortase family protein
MSKKINNLLTTLEPYKGILYFLFLLFFFHFSWKIAIDGDMDDTRIYLFGKDITPAWFDTSCQWLTAASSWFIRLFPGMNDLVTGPTSLRFPVGGSVSIIWGCTGIKQMFIFAAIMACYFGPWKKKLWYIPMGCIILTVYNVIRIGGIVMLIKGHPERFESLHDGIFRYIYYTIIFLLWVYWEEFINKRNQKLKSQKDTK